jgi:PAS domain S-box-containing protein
VIILVAVALVTFFAFQGVTEELVLQRDLEVAFVSADQVAAALDEYEDLLTTLARTADIYENDPATQRDALKRAGNRLTVFDGGVLLLDDFGTVLAAEPERPEVLGQDWSDRAYFQESVRSQIAGLPPELVLSDIVADGPDGSNVIVCALPIVGERGESRGMLVGMFRVAPTAINAFYGDIIKLRTGRSGSTYLVDGEGRVIYHSDAGRIGEDFATQAVVQQVLSGQTNALRTRDFAGQDIVAGFSPVPGTPWGLVTEETWVALTSGFRGYRNSLLSLLALGVVVPALVVAVGIRRITGPIEELISAAQGVARGNFGQTITAQTGDEIEELAQQFNLMSAQLQASYTDLEQRVADRTRELAALNDERARRNRELVLLNRVIAATTSRLEPKAVLEAVCRELILAFGLPHAAAAMLDEAGATLTVVAEYESEKFPSALGAVIPVEGNPATRYVLEHKEPLAVADAQHDPRMALVHDLMRQANVVSLLILPLVVRGEVVGTIGLDAAERRQFSDEEITLAANAAAAASQALENARAEEALRRSQQKLSLHVQHTPLAYIEWDADLQVVDWNPAAERIFGYSKREAKNCHAYEIIVPPEVQPHVTNVWQSILNQTGGTRSTNENVTKDGREILCEWYNTPLIDDDGGVIGLASLVQDITERVQAEEKLREAKEAAETASRAKGAFLANMSHELRTPLNAILGFSQLMAHDPGLTADQQEYLETIGRSGEHLLGLINDVLELSKIDVGRVTLQEESFDLHRLLDGLEEMFRLRAADKRLVLIIDRAPDVPQYVRTDQGKLRQVLMNLLGNAVKFTREGRITLRVGSIPQVSFVEEYEAGSRETAPSTTPPPLLPFAHSPHAGSVLLHFEVEDTGPGIAPEELDAVFDAFVQTASGQASKEGTGLGLPISQQFVRLMGGDLTVSSELGQGSLFKFDVQIELVDAADVPTSQPARRVIGLEPDQRAADGGPYRLLVAEDQEASRKLLSRLLEPLGFEVREAVNGQEALEIWEQWDPHLIWMDMRMPVVDGHQATKQIKATTKGQDTVIIALTASAFEEDRQVILSEGCDGFVRKPFREAEIFDKLTKHLGVCFVYEEVEHSAQAQQPADTAASPQERLTPAALAALPTDWVAEVYQAAVQADGDLVLDLVEQIRAQHPSVADALASLARNYRLDIIMTLTQDIGG